MAVNFFQNPKNQQLVESFLLKVDQRESPDPNLGVRRAGMSFDVLRSYITTEEQHVVDYILGIDPKTLGFKGQKLGIEEVPSNLISIENQLVYSGGKEVLLPAVLVPGNVFEGYQRMRNAIQDQIGNDLFIESGYRSPAYQIVTLLYYLKMNNFDLAATAKRVAFPGYSEHGSPSRQALDFMNKDGKPTDEMPLDFEDTEEFRWLLSNAGRFGFVLSYPKDNKDGIMYEPWHWRFEGI